jgi:tetratricopeptide (TPR) repeat protein
LRSEFTEEELRRLSLDQLVAHGRDALREQAYRRAAGLLREAVRRAPFRQDLREWMAMALEGSIEERVLASPAAAPPDVAASPLKTTPAASRSDAPPRTADPRARRGEFDLDAPPLPRLPRPGRTFGSTSAARTTPSPATADAAAKTGASGRPAARQKKPTNFERRHRRGPFSALLLGAVAGLVLAAGAGAGVWWYLERQARGSGGGPLLPMVSQARQTDVMDAANEYLARGETTLAIDTLMQLPDGPDRNRKLAEIYMSRGDYYFLRQQPPNYEAAIEAYKEALKYVGDNARYGNALARAYYTLSRVGADNVAEREANMRQAFTIYRSVVDLNPPNRQDLLTALKGLADAAVALRDDTTAAAAWRRIIDAAPDSEDARQARNNLDTRGFKVE